MSDTVEERWTRHSEAGRRFMSERKYSEAEKAFLAAIKEARQLGAEDLRMAASLSSLGLLKYKQRDLVQAEMLLRQSLSIRERTLGSEHVGIVQSMSYLAAVYYARGELDRADELFRRALRISEKHLGEDHPDVATMISNLAQLHFKRGDFPSAGQLLTRLLAIREKALGEYHPEVAAILSRLAQVRYAELDTEGAEMLSRRALAIRVRAEGASKEGAVTRAEVPAEAPRPVEPKPALVSSRLTSETPLAAKPFGESVAPETLTPKPAPVRPLTAPIVSPAPSLQGWADRLPAERTPVSPEPPAAAPLFSAAAAEPDEPTEGPYDDDPYGDDLPVTAPRYLTRRIELPWGGMELWKVAAGALLVLGLGTTMIFSGDDSTPVVAEGATPASAAAASVPVPGKSDVVLYSAAGDPKVIDSVTSAASSQVESTPEPKAAESSAPRRTASTSSSRPASKPKPQVEEDEEEVPASALSASTLKNALKSIDAALDPNSLVSRLARARSAVDSVNRLQVKTGFEPK